VKFSRAVSRARERDGAVMALARALVRKKATSGAASARRRRE